MPRLRHVTSPDPEVALCGHALSAFAFTFLHAAQAQNGYPCIDCVVPDPDTVYLLQLCQQLPKDYSHPVAALAQRRNAQWHEVALLSPLSINNIIPDTSVLSYLSVRRISFPQPATT